MTYIALARKYRPRTFAELIGQTHVTKALSNALTRQQLHHAYLFTGTRGVGKTSGARLFAKSLNCETGVTATPCLTCDTCRAIEEGRYIDLIEIDAASKTRVEDTREVLDNVMYAPTQGRFKIYLIDEVHMLSTHSFNALLKTLEEPPEHVKFLLATTEIQKLPMTILSRCLKFHLKALDTDLIQNHLDFILSQEKISFEKDALPLIAKAADGSVRDALSLLDQIIALSDEHGIQTQTVKQTLGHTTKDYAVEILQALIDNNAQTLLALSEAIAKDGGQYQYVLDELLSHLHHISCLHFVPQETAPLHALSQQISPEDAQLFYQIAIKGQNELALAPTRAIGFEMTLLRMLAFKPESPATPPAAPTPVKKAVPPPKAKTPQKTATPASHTHHTEETWENILPKLKLTGLALNAAKQADLKREKDNTATLYFDKNHRSLFTEGVLKKLEEQISQYYNQSIKLNLQSDTQSPNSPAAKERVKAEAKQAAHEKKLNEDPSFQALKETFGATLQE